MANDNDAGGSKAITFVMPDGTRMKGRMAAGTTEEQLQQAALLAKKQWSDARSTAAASTLMQAGGGGVPIGTAGLGTTVADLAKGAVRGGAEGVLGMVQAGSDLTGALFPGLRDRTSEISKAIPGEMDKIRAKLPLSDENVGAIGELGGSMVPTAAVPGGPVVQGIVGGATALLPEGGDLVDRLTGAALGGTFGKILDLGGKQIAKIANAKGLQGKIDAVKEMFTEVSPAAAPLKRQMNSTIERKWQRYSDLGKLALDEGDKLGALDVSKLASKAQGLATDAGKVSGQDASAVKLLNDTGRVLSEPVNMPPSLTVGGAKFTRDPMSGEYKNAAGDVLNPTLTKAALPPDAGPPDVRYKNLKAMQENLDEYLAKHEGSNNDAVKKVRELREAIGTRLDEVRSPQIKALEKKAQSFYDKELGKYDKDTIERLLGAKDDFERARIVLQDVVRGKDADPALAKDVSEMLGKPGRESVSAHMMHDATINAMDKQGRFDPVKFMHYFDDKPGFEPFKAEHFDEVAKGFSSYIKHQATLQGESTTPGIGTVGRHALSLATTGARIVGHAATGNIGGVVKAVGEYLAPYAGLSLANRAFQDTFLRHMFIVASRLPEGSPRWQRVMGQISSRFAGPIAGQGGQIGSQVSNLMGQPGP